jgi:AmmeMemoRadiSam system protein B/AmmeMemoRadiSam system protein A
MARRRCITLWFYLFFLFTCSCGQDNTTDRQPSAAGQFYPGTPARLENTLTDLLAHAPRPPKAGTVLAILVPHAGYVYSGSVAASGFAQIDTNKRYENVFIIGPSHYVDFTGAAVYTAGDYSTPLGRVAVNRPLGKALVQEEPLFSERTDAHEQEHSVEVEVPFLQHLLKDRLRIVPIVVGSNTPAGCRQLGKALRPYFNEKNLFVISSDFSHYPSSDDATSIDRATCEAIVANSPARLLSVLHSNEARGVRNLVTSLCGWSAVLTFLSMSSTADVTITPVEYHNSGDAAIGDAKRVVGYWSMVITANEDADSPILEERDKETLLGLARESIVRFLDGRPDSALDAAPFPPSLRKARGAFVTLNVHGRMRGCIGRFEPSEPLYRTVEEMAVSAATRDPRFQPVTPDELRNIDIEISVLTPLRRIHSIDEFELGRHGIYIRKGGRSGTFLPQVAEETGWTKEEFLGHCAADKAGVGWEGWKDADLYVYEAVVFGEK